MDDRLDESPVSADAAIDVEPGGPVPPINVAAAEAFEELVGRLQQRWADHNHDGKLGIKVASYRKAATQLRRLTTPIDHYGSERALQTIPGVGPAIAKKLWEFRDRGSFKLLDELRRDDVG